jgi:hypothetical protein
MLSRNSPIIASLSCTAMLLPQFLCIKQLRSGLSMMQLLNWPVGAYVAWQLSVVAATCQQ